MPTFRRRAILLQVETFTCIIDLCIWCRLWWFMHLMLKSLCMQENKNDGPNDAEASRDHFLLLSIISLDHSLFDDTARIAASLSLEEPQGTKGNTRHCSHGSNLRRRFFYWSVRCQRKWNLLPVSGVHQRMLRSSREYTVSFTACYLQH